MSRLLHLDRSLEDLEGERWPEPSAGTTHLVRTVHALRRVQVGALTVDDLRTLIAQDVGLPFLLPVALDVLRNDPPAEGRYYEGDLLSVVMRKSPAAWSMFPDLRRELVAVVSSLPEVPEELTTEVGRFLDRADRP
ncbi:contact-dependent growth inhibition system immunity protein [Streptomyces sp. NBC_00467]|uniref:contact-dependent growth inhibition system immunity protein n=1 Tax=Streptomyces sp. NBC_00467 TaxID=2975752 RepID=UPI002E180861